MSQGGSAANPVPALAPPIPGHRVELLSSVDSTNAEARRRVLAGRAEAGLVLLTVDQTAGRGRRGRSWACVPGRSLATTLVVNEPDLQRLSRVTLLAAVAACRALEANGSPSISIKWPNDLMRGEAKLAGILVERVAAPTGRQLLLVGVGINLALRAGDLPEELDTLATDAGLDASAGTRNAVLHDLVLGFEAALRSLGTPADETLGLEYSRRSWLDGRRVELLFEGQAQTVQVARVSPEGDLLLADGRTLRGEHVELLAQRPPR